MRPVSGFLRDRVLTLLTTKPMITMTPSTPLIDYMVPTVTYPQPQDENLFPAFYPETF